MDGRGNAKVRRVRYARSRVALGAVLCALALCAGCGGATSGAATPSDIPSDALMQGVRSTYGQYEHTVTLIPAYRQQIEEELQRNVYRGGSEPVEAVIADNVITADEMDELERGVVACYAKYDLQPNVDYYFNEFGTGMHHWDLSHHDFLRDPERINQLELECEFDSGYSVVTQYYWQAYTNPDNIDIKPYQYQCFKEHDLLAMDLPTYEDYLRAYNGQRSGPLVKGMLSTTPLINAQVERCDSDPLHNIANSPLGK